MTERERRAVKRALKDVAGRLLQAAYDSDAIRLELPDGTQPNADEVAAVLEEVYLELCGK